MAPQPLESRVESLENRVTHVEQQLGPTDLTQPQILPLRTEMRAEFSAVRGEIAEQGKALRGEIAEQGGKVTTRIAELEAKIDEQRTHTRVLHEEVISRIALLQEGMLPQPPTPRKE